jgi:hypothetical protein
VRVVLVEHQTEPVLVEAEHVAHMAGVLERRPLIGGGAQSGVGMGEQLDELVGSGPHQVGHHGRRRGGAVEPAVGTGPLEHPGPVLVVGRDRQGFARSLAERFRGNPMQLAVRDRATGEFLGTYAYVQDVTDLLGDSIILGWWLVADARGKGLGHDSLQLVLRWLHDEVLVGTIRMGTLSDNVRAITQIERTGARLQHEHPTLLPNGTAPMGKWYVHEL